MSSKAKQRDRCHIEAAILDGYAKGRPLNIEWIVRQNAGTNTRTVTEALARMVRDGQAELTAKHGYVLR
jgi:predicted transcriptional regulator